MSDTAGSGSLSSESLSSGSLSLGAERTIFNVPVTTVGNGSSKLEIPGSSDRNSLANVLSPMLMPMANMKHALIDPVVTYKGIPQADVSLKKKKPAKKKPTATTKGDGSAIQQQGGLVQGGQPPPGPDGPWEAVNGVELSPNAPDIGTRAYISLAYAPQGPNGNHCPEGYTMAPSSKENPWQTCILNKAVGYTIAPPPTLKPIGGVQRPPPQGYNWWVDYSTSPQGIRQGSDVRKSIIANGKLAKMRGMEQIISPSFLETTLTRLGEMSENMKALTTINENVSSLNENVKALLEASKRANTTEVTAEEAETNNSQEGGRRRRRKTKGRRKGRRGTRR